MESNPIEAHALIREAVRKFAKNEIAPVCQALCEDEQFPYALWKKSGELGFTGLPYPEAFGGGGGDWLAFVIVIEELARIDCSVANALMANSSVASLLDNFGSQAQKEKFLRPILDGSRIGAIALTEPGAGSDAAAIRTKAVVEGDYWVIDGSKIFISNSGTDITGPVVIAAVTGTRPDRRNEISNLIVPNGTPGFEYGKKLKKIGWRASSTFELFFRHCAVPRDHLLGERGAGLRQMLSTIETGRILVGAQGLGILQGSLDRSKSYMNERTAFGNHLAHFQGLQFMVADMATHAHAARLMLYHAAGLKDAGRPFGQEAAMSKLFATEKAMEAAHHAVQIHGGYGIMSEYAVSRAFGDAKVLEIVEGTSEIQRIVIARAQLGVA